MYRQNIVRSKVLLIIVFCLSISFVQATDDNSIGDFDAVAWDNDPFILLEWFTTEELIAPLVDVEFSLTVYDEDNTSDELNVTLFYSSDSEFEFNNISATLLFTQENSPHNFTYIYTLAGQLANTRVYYYYQVTDGETVDRKPIAGEYYDILWNELAIPIIHKGYYTSRVIGEVVDYAPYAIIPIFVMLIFFIFFLGKRKQ